MIVVEAVLEDRLEDEVLAAFRVLGVVHRGHVQRRHVRLQRLEVGDPLLERHADRAGRVVDDHVADLAADRLGDRAEVLDLVGGDAVGSAGVDVDLRSALVDGPPRLGRVLLRRVRDRRALVAVGDRARDRAGDDHGVGEVAHQRPFRPAERRSAEPAVRGGRALPGPRCRTGRVTDPSSSGRASRRTPGRPRGCPRSRRSATAASAGSRARRRAAMSCWRYIASCPSRISTGDFEASLPAQSATAASNSPPGTTLLASP